MRNPLDFYYLTYSYLKNAYKNSVVHTEMCISPQIHTESNTRVSFDIIMAKTHEAMKDAEKNLGITSNLIVNFPRNLNFKKSVESENATLDK